MVSRQVTARAACALLAAVSLACVWVHHTSFGPQREVLLRSGAQSGTGAAGVPGSHRRQLGATASRDVPSSATAGNEAPPPPPPPPRLPTTGMKPAAEVPARSRPAAAVTWTPPKPRLSPLMRGQQQQPWATVPPAAPGRPAAAAAAVSAAGPAPGLGAGTGAAGNINIKLKRAAQNEEPDARTPHTLPYPQHVYAVEHDMHVLVSAAHKDANLASCLDSILRQGYAKLRIWVHGEPTQAAAAWGKALIDTKFSAEPRVTFLSGSNKDVAAELWWALQQVRAAATPNDLVMVMDSKHYMLTDAALSQVNGKFVDTKAWVVHSSYLADNGDPTVVQTGAMDARALVATSDAVCTFKAFLVDRLQARDFDVAGPVRADSRALRVRYMLHIMDLAGKARTAAVPTPLHGVSRGAAGQEGGKAKGGEVAVQRKLGAVERAKVLEEDIHVFLVVWGRRHLLQKTLYSLMRRQTVSHRIRLHVWNNNPDIKSQVDLVASIMSSRIDVTHSDVNLYSYARFLDIKQSMLQYHIDYAIIVDDDQLFPTDYIQKLYAQRQPKTYLSWWGRQFHGQSYFNGVPTGPELMRGLHREVTQFDYAGPGGCIIDAGAFMMAATFMIPLRFISLDDLWISYVVNMAGWRALRTFVRPRFIMDPKTTSVALWAALKSDKDEFLNYLRQGGWQV